jgi:Mrp family chromosome partitioning ATPase
LAERPSINLAFAAAAGGEVLLVDADTYGGAVAHATIQEHLMSTIS